MRDALCLGFALLAISCLSISCSSTFSEKVAPVHRAYYAGDTAGARSQLERLLAEEDGGPDRSCLLLDGAVVDMAAGRAAPAEKTLRTVRDEFDRVEEEEAKAFFGDLLSYLTDDRSSAYGGEDYEKILIRVMLAFANMMRGGDDVVAYANQVLDKQREIIDQEAPDRSGKKFKSGYKMIGAGAYLYGMVTEERDPSATGEVRISYQRVKEWEPQFTQIDADLARLENGAYAAEGNGVLHVFAFVGKGPIKVEIERGDVAVVSEIVTQILQFIPQVAKHYGPTLDLSPIRVPEVVADPTNTLASVAVEVDGAASGTTETLTDITETAIQQYRIVRDWVLAKAVIRRMVKKAIVTGIKGTGKMLTDRGGDSATGVLWELGGIVANTVWSALERADTRSWSLLPDAIQVLRLELPAGDHEITLVPLARGGVRGLPRSVRVRILPGQGTSVFVFAPTAGRGPAPLTTRPAPAPAVAASGS